MRVVIMGIGNFGHHFARRLSAQKIEILAIDIHKPAVDEVAGFVTHAVVGDVTNRELLEELDVGSADYVIISLGDEHMDPSILATLHSRSLGAKNVYAKAISDDHARILELIGATRIIHPEREVAESLAEALGKPNVLDFIPLGEEYSIVEFEPPSEYVGKSLAELDLRHRYGVTVIGVKEYFTGSRRMNPGPDLVVQDDVSLLIMGRDDQVKRLQKDVR
ncbi:MAG: potassium channel family protein [Gemmatimonadota bacterium]